MNQNPSPNLSHSWQLVVAGVTPLGRRRAVRAVTAAIEQGMDVLVVDGHLPHLIEDDFDLSDTADSNLAIHSFGDAERQGLAWRMIDPGSSGRARFLGKTTSRRIGTMIRPLVFWSLVRRTINSLKTGPAPQIIVCCDDVSITTAWKASKIWPNVPVRDG